MKQNSPISKKEKEDIFSLFIKKRRLRFSDIEKELKIRSNNLSYYLDALIKENVLIKKDDCYFLTKEAEKLIPHFAHITGKESSPLPIVVAAIRHNNKICLLRRAKRPYQGYWGMIGGKIRLDESVEDCAVREAKEETGLNCRFKRVCSVLHEHVKEENFIKHAFLIFLCELETSDVFLKECDEGRIEWFNIYELPDKIIPSDKMMIESLLTDKLQFKKILISEKEGELLEMKVD